MASITVRFYSLWRLYIGLDRVALEADDVDDALSQLQERFGTQLWEQLKRNNIRLDGNLRESSIVLLNGISLRNLKQTTVKNGDVLHVFPPVAGG